jgi:hypothetical protein
MSSPWDTASAPMAHGLLGILKNYSGYHRNTEESRQVLGEILLHFGSASGSVAVLRFKA